MRAYLAQVRHEVLASLRQGEQVLVSAGIPVLVLVFFGLVDVLPGRDGVSRLGSLVPAVLALAVMSTSMVSLGIGTGFERYYGVLKRLGSTPLGRGRLVAAKITFVGVVEAGQLLLLTAIAFALGWRPLEAVAGGRGYTVGSAVDPWVIALAGVVLGTAAFAGLGLLLAGTLKGTVNLALCNALYLVLLLFGGIVIPPDELPGPLGTVAGILPSGALSDVLHGAFNPDALAGRPFVVLAAWAVVLPLAAVRLFRWE